MKRIQLILLVLVVLFAINTKAESKGNIAFMIPINNLILEDEKEVEAGVKLLPSNFSESKTATPGETSVTLGCYAFNVLANERLDVRKIIATVKVTNVSNSYFRDLDLSRVDLFRPDNSQVGTAVNTNFNNLDKFIFGLDEGNKSKVKFEGAILSNGADILDNTHCVRVDVSDEVNPATTYELRNISMKGIKGKTTGNDYKDVKIILDSQTVTVEAVSVEVATNAATDITSISARLNGEIKFGGDDIEVWFALSNEFGSSPSCSNSSQREDVPGMHEEGDAFFRNIENLQEGTNYFYRACAEDDVNASFGPIKLFSTENIFYESNLLVSKTSSANSYYLRSGVNNFAATSFNVKAKNEDSIKSVSVRYSGLPNKDDIIFGAVLVDFRGNILSEMEFFDSNSIAEFDDLRIEIKRGDDIELFVLLNAVDEQLNFDEDDGKPFEIQIIEVTAENEVTGLPIVGPEHKVEALAVGEINVSIVNEGLNASIGKQNLLAIVEYTSNTLHPDDVTFNRSLRIENTGSGDFSDLENIFAELDGEEYTGVIDPLDDDFLIFNFNDYEQENGDSEEVEIRATPIGGSGDTFFFQVSEDEKSNINVVDQSGSGIPVNLTVSGSPSVIGDATIQVLEDVSSPDTQLVVEGAEVILGVLEVEAEDGEVIIEDANLRLDGDSKAFTRERVYIEVEDVEVGIARFTSGNSDEVEDVDVLIEDDETVEHVFTTTITSSVGEDEDVPNGERVFLCVTSVTPEDSDVNVVGIDDGNTVEVEAEEICFDPVYVFETIPSISQVPFPNENVELTSGPNRELLRWSTTADEAGDLTVGGMTFDITGSATSKIVDGTMEVEVFTSSDLVNKVATNDGDFFFDVATGKVSFKDDNTDIYLEIPKGKTYYFRAVADFTGIVDGDEITVALKEDEEFNKGNLAASDMDGITSVGNFVWSPDFNTGENTDFFNGFEVDGMDSDIQATRINEN